MYSLFSLLVLLLLALPALGILDWYECIAAGREWCEEVVDIKYRCCPPPESYQGACGAAWLSTRPDCYYGYIPERRETVLQEEGCC